MWTKLLQAFEVDPLSLDYPWVQHDGNYKCVHKKGTPSNQQSDLGFGRRQKEQGKALLNWRRKSEQQFVDGELTMKMLYTHQYLVIRF